jgi:hypothetical protein
MIESQLVREWKDTAKLEGRIEATVKFLLRQLSGKYKGVAEHFARKSKIVAIWTSWSTGTHWYDVALIVDSLEEFRKQTGL